MDGKSEGRGDDDDGVQIGRQVGSSVARLEAR